MADVVLCYPRTGLDIGSSIAPPHNLLCVAAPLVRAGYDVKIIDQRVNPHWKDDLTIQVMTKPIFVGISAMTGTQIKHAIEIAVYVRELKSYKSLPIVWGGAHPTLLPEQVLATGLADHVCKGEVDETIVQIARDIEHGKAKSIIASPLPDVETLLCEPYHLLDIEKYIHPDIYVKDSPRTMDVGQSSRGCPFQCIVGGTPIDTPNRSCAKVEKIYDKKVGVVGYENGQTKQSDILYGEQKMAEEVIEITIADGRSLYVTSNHPIYTKRGWVNAGDLTENDEVLTIKTAFEIKRVLKRCEFCGSYKVMAENAKYCSRECHDKAQIKERQSKNCPVCGKVFNTHKSSMLHQVCCSRSCSTKLNNSKRDMTYMVDNLKTPEILEKIRLSKVGDKNPMKRPEVKAKVVATQRERGLDKQFGQRIKKMHEQGLIPRPLMTDKARASLSERMRQDNPMYDHELAKVVGERRRALYQNDDFYRNNLLESRIRHPNKMEQQLTEIIVRNSLPFKFTGDFTYWVGKCKSGKCRNPDYVDTGHKKKVILANGLYHHKNPILNQVELDDYSGMGYKTLVIWENEITQDNEFALVNKIRTFYED